MHVRLLLPLLALVPLACRGPGGAASGGGEAPPLPGYRAPRAHAPVQPPVDVEHYALELRVDPALGRLDGTARVRLFARTAGLRRVELFLVDLVVLDVTDGFGRPLAYEHAGGRLVIELAEPLELARPLELVVRYGGAPTRGLLFAGGEPPTHVFTQGQCADARYWFPCVDVPSERATSELVVSLPAGWTAVAAGELVARRDLGDAVVEHWRMNAPHATYLTTLVAGDFGSVHTDWEGLPLGFYGPRRLAEHVAPSLVAPTVDALAFLTELTGRRFPYAKYSTACVDDFPSGGMENVSATTLSSRVLRDAAGRADDDSVALIVHEAAHQWFGDLLTCSDWSHAWLNEGFATYAALLYVEARQGADAFRVGVRAARDRALAADAREGTRPLVHDVYTDPYDLFTAHVYQGGAARLHLLRFKLGEQAFRRGVQLYVGRNAGRGVVTDDLRRAFEEASGEDLEAFFAQWVRAPGHPTFEVRWRHDAARERVLLTVNQTQAAEGGVPEVFATPVDVEVRDATGARMHRLSITRRRELFELPAPQAPEWVRFDKYGWLPARVESRKSTGEWLRIAAGDDDVNGRRDALAELALRHVASEDAGVRAAILGALIGRLESDAAPAVRVAAAQALARTRADEAREALARRASADDAPGVRVAALEALAAFCPDARLAALGRALVEEGPTWDVRGVAAVLVVRADPAGAAGWVAGLAARPDSPQGDLARHRARALGVLADVPALCALLADAGAAPAARAEAARQLGRVGAGAPRARAALGAELGARDAHVRRAALAALSALGDAGALAVLRAHYPASRSSRERRAIEAAFGLE
jgi:aminopeptidase N